MLSKALAMAFVLVLLGCQTTDGSLQEQGKNVAYIQGFHDGRHSGMREAGSNWEHYLRDEARFTDDTDYKTGWQAGELEGIGLQNQATAIGSAVGNTYSGAKISKEVDKSTVYDGIATDAAKGMDTSGLENLGK
ncbi:MAG: hypothetical protein ACI9JM_002056 [Halioglobus sp.]|jgi:hypothetical protein